MLPTPPARPEITAADLAVLRTKLAPLLGIQIPSLVLPKAGLSTITAGSLGTMVGTTMDAALPDLSAYGLPDVGLRACQGPMGQRALYPDYTVEPTAYRVELKGLYVDPDPALLITRAPAVTRREASARVKESVRLSTIDAARDVLLVCAYRFEPLPENDGLFSPRIIDFDVFSMCEIVRARDFEFTLRGGIWFDSNETPAVVSEQGAQKLLSGQPLDASRYGIKRNSGCDYNKDTNFGKLKRVPYQPLQDMLKRHGLDYTPRGSYPKPWAI